MKHFDKESCSYRDLKFNNPDWFILVTNNRELWKELSIFPLVKLKDSYNEYWEGLKIGERTVLFLDFDFNDNITVFKSK